VLGGGDVKMMALIGAFTGPWGAVLTVFLGALCGVLAYLALRLLLGTRQLVPFGVFLAVGGAITLWWGEALLSWYLALTGLPSP
jgi:leader peptidase (prepilin peptidase)/N-methyltransferase